MNVKEVKIAKRRRNARNAKKREFRLPDLKRKRAINTEESKRLSKRPRTTVSQCRNATISSNLRTTLDIRDI
jgi:hypothetical protein